MHTPTPADLSAPTSLDQFDTRSGSRLERLIFNHRFVVMVVCALITLLLGFFAATRLTLNASFEKLLANYRATHR